MLELVDFGTKYWDMQLVYLLETALVMGLIWFLFISLIVLAGQEVVWKRMLFILLIAAMITGSLLVIQPLHKIYAKHNVVYAQEIVEQMGNLGVDMTLEQGYEIGYILIRFEDGVADQNAVRLKSGSLKEEGYYTYNVLNNRGGEDYELQIRKVDDDNYEVVIVE